jgi:hypothetical protein
LCDTNHTAAQYEKQVFAGSQNHCEQFIKGYNRGRKKVQQSSMATLSEWLDKHRDVHTCEGAAMPVFQGAEAYLKYGHVTAEDWNKMSS